MALLAVVKAENLGVDLLLVDMGDPQDENGLSDAKKVLKLQQEMGRKYLTGNVQIHIPQTGNLECIGAKYRYSTMDHGLRIMAYGIIFDFN
ncbi:hypothetical protein BJ875DRAFT_488681 [Amylocarpus encephaloides]|uniref:Uncharacterized protein n=1 Tax=Amylocarpus encephaloides TaxID=45428 RepID=A0A9P8C0V8_9HELO|nr:hypothetical protein BJ875DRAFT_488681 [Amylocarpus encephaloides]